MKISSASKKVLASALSAAMVVAFAPTAAFAGSGAITTPDTSKWSDAAWLAAGYTVKVDYVDTQTSALKTEYFANLAAVDQEGVVTLLDNQELSNVKANLAGTLNLNGFSISQAEAAAQSNTITVASGKSLTISGEGTISNKFAGYAAVATLEGATALTIGSDVTIAGAAKDTDGDGKLDVKGNGTWFNAGTVKINGATITGGNEAIHDEGAAVTVKGGTYEGITLKGGNDTVDGAAFTDGLITEGVTVKGAVKVTKTTDATVNGTVPGTKTAVKGVSGTASVQKDATLEVEVSAAGDNINAVAIDGVTVAGQNAIVSAAVTATGADSNATAIGSLSGTTNKGAEVTAKAVATGNDTNPTGHATTVAIAIAAGANLEISEGSVAGTATSADSAAYGIKLSDKKLTISGKGTAAFEGNGYNAASSYAVDTLGGTDADDDNVFAASAGKYTGKVTNIKADGLTGGSYTQGLTTANYNENEYEVVDDGTYYTVSQYAGYSLYNNAIQPLAGSDAAPAGLGDETVFNAVKGALNGAEGAATLAYTEGNTLATLQAQTKKDGTEKLGLYFSVKTYNAKTATTEQTAAYDAIMAYAGKANSVLQDPAVGVKVTTLALGYKDKTTGAFVKMADVTDLGSTKLGRETKANTVTLGTENSEDTTYVAYDGKAVSALAYTKNADGIRYDCKVTALPAAYAELAISTKALADAIANQKPAAEKATQSISVDQKSLTVKLGAKKSQTAKGKSFAMGATAETELTTAWKSGSTKITVSGDKVKLAKGAKRGTYKAKVSLKAAASDEYLAAAATITVKFVIK